MRHMTLNYLVHLQRTEAAWSRPGGFQQCINWCRGVLDLEVEPDFMNSPRVAGLCKGFESHAPAPKRAPALTFEEVRYVEAVAASCPNVQDVVIAGAILFMLFACARASDAARAVSLHVDFSDSTGSTVWIEAVKKSKTAMGARSRLLLPLLPCVIFDEIWVGHWMEAREHLGLGVSGDIDIGSMVPLFDETGAWSGRPMAWLRAVLGKDFPEATRLSSHSLKATGLSWAASAGVPLDTLRTMCTTVRVARKQKAETFSRRPHAFSRRCFWPSEPATSLQTILEGVSSRARTTPCACRQSHPWWRRKSSSGPGNRQHRSGRWLMSRTFRRQKLTSQTLTTAHQRGMVRTICRWTHPCLSIVKGARLSPLYPHGAPRGCICLRVAGGPHGEERLLCGRKRSDVQELDARGAPIASRTPRWRTKKGRLLSALSCVMLFLWWLFRTCQVLWRASSTRRRSSRGGRRNSWGTRPSPRCRRKISSVSPRWRTRWRTSRTT